MLRPEFIVGVTVGGTPRVFAHLVLQIEPGPQRWWIARQADSVSPRHTVQPSKAGQGPLQPGCRFAQRVIDSPNANPAPVTQPATRTGLKKRRAM